MRAKRHKQDIGDERAPESGVSDIPERWSVQRKTEVVLHLLRGEPLEDVSRQSQVAGP